MRDYHFLIICFNHFLKIRLYHILVSHWGMDAKDDCEAQDYYLGQVLTLYTDGFYLCKIPR